MRIVLFIIKFLLFGALFAVSNNDLYLKDAADRAEFFSIYNSWSAELFSNAGSITSYIINLDWAPKTDANVMPALDG